MKMTKKKNKTGLLQVSIFNNKNNNNNNKMCIIVVIIIGKPNVIVLWFELNAFRVLSRKTYCLI